MEQKLDWVQMYVDLAEAVRDLYFAAHWTADRPVNEEMLWTAIREAAGIEPGQSPEMGWQPIKTAPRDRVFLGYNSDDDIYAIGFWCKGRWVTPPSARTERFSHWMPLPPPPEVTAHVTSA